MHIELIIVCWAADKKECCAIPLVSSIKFKCFSLEKTDLLFGENGFLGVFRVGHFGIQGNISCILLTSPKLLSRRIVNYLL